uniref:Putative inorganic phosphate cotransporter n=1 Tax=Triatoma dimidiata TaxID=72491 RepID=A0A0V0G4B5_TRIDM
MEVSESKQELGETMSSLFTKEANYGKCCNLPKRHIQIGMLFLYYFTIFITRTNLSVAIVSMTDKNSSNPNFEEFKWNEKEKSAVLSSFFWGYLVIQAPAGQLGQHFSPRLLLLITNLTSALMAALTPTAAYSGGWQLLCAVRTVQGLCQGFALPMTYKLASKWSPVHERNRFVGFSLNGATLGAASALPICGLLAESSGGWPSIFYTSAVLGLTWSILWAWFGADSPATHSSITTKEKQEIEKSLEQSEENKVYKTPWKEIFSSVPFWALIITHLSAGWGLSIVITETPSFINSILKYNVGINGILSSIPFYSLWICTFPVCWFADYLQKRMIISVNVGRKLWTTLYLSGSGTALIFLGYIGESTIAILVTLTLCVTCSAFIFSGFIMNHLDLSPNFAGVLVGIANGLENITMILAPLSVGFIVDDPKSADQWRMVFIISACIGYIGNLVFLIFGSTKLQSWNTPIEINKNKDDSINTQM